MQAKSLPAGPDGIRRERPHLRDALQAQSEAQVCVLAVRPVVPSSLHRPPQPFNDSLRAKEMDSLMPVVC